MKTKYTKTQLLAYLRELVSNDDTSDSKRFKAVKVLMKHEPDVTINILEEMVMTDGKNGVAAAEILIRIADDFDRYTIFEEQL